MWELTEEEKREQEERRKKLLEVRILLFFRVCIPHTHSLALSLAMSCPLCSSFFGTLVLRLSQEKRRQLLGKKKEVKEDPEAAARRQERERRVLSFHLHLLLSLSLPLSHLSPLFLH